MRVIFFFNLLICFGNSNSQTTITEPIKVLVVTAHPDDETAMAATIYKIAKELHGTVDQVVITNGEGGYKYSTLAEGYYGIELTNETVGRANLPRIRKQELMNAGKIIGLNNIYFLDQKDARYGLDELEPLDTTWNVTMVKTRLMEIMTQTHYDYIFCLLPVPETHAHHKAATILALRCVEALPQKLRPIVLGVTGSSLNDSISQTFQQLKNYSETRIDPKQIPFSFNRATPFGYNNKLNYKIIVNWEIAEHKSQGTIQLAMNGNDLEDFWFFSMNPPEAFEKCAAFFNLLKEVPYKIKGQ